MPVQRKPNMDTTGIKRVTVLAFDGGQKFTNQATYATNAAIMNLQATNAFTIVSPTIVDAAKSRGENMESYVDAIFTGQILRVEFQYADPVVTTWTDRQGKTNRTTTYETSVLVELNYHFSRSRDGSMIGPRVRVSTEKATSTEKQPDHAPLINAAIDNIFRSMRSDVAPYTTFVTRTLHRDKFNKDLQKNQMKQLEQLVKAGNYVSAKNSYIAIWDSHRSIAAAINASFLMEATGQTIEARDFMQNVLTATASPDVQARLNQLNSEISAQTQLVEFVAASRQSNVSNATNHAIAEIRNVLPNSPRIWIQNITSAHHNIANEVIDNMTSNFIASGITFVERQAINIALDELNFQLTEFVSDDQMTQLGRMIGATNAILVSITGEGARRRLSVRVLDISTGRILMQSSTDSSYEI
jgi:hypothetical protein